MFNGFVMIALATGLFFVSDNSPLTQLNHYSKLNK